MNRDRVSVLGIQIDNVSIHQAVARVTSMVDAGGTHQVATANSDFVTNALEDESVRNILTNCDLVVPDGMPLVWISRLLGTPLKERVAGVDLIHQLARESAHRGDRIFLLGSSEANLVASTRKLRTLYPEIQICGYYSPPQTPLADMNNDAIAEKIKEARPDIVLVAFGHPKQERWIVENSERMGVPVMIGVGGSFEFISGATRRAPVWMQRSGMEWLFRTLGNPRRLAKRYLHDFVCLCHHLPKACLANKFPIPSSRAARDENIYAGNSAR